MLLFKWYIIKQDISDFKRSANFPKIFLNQEKCAPEPAAQDKFGRMRHT